MDAPRPAVLTDAALAAELRRAGFRLTRPRVTVYRALRELGGHRSADEVLAFLRRRVSRMSVYNALASLETAGVILKADAGPGRALFEASSVWHHHFLCRRCGGIFDVPCFKARKPCLELSAAVGRADEAQVIFRGTCRACLKRSR